MMFHTRRGLLAAGSALLLLASCLTPPPLPAKPGAANAATGAAAPAATPTEPLAFSGTSSELLSKLRIGWNLGNSFDAPESETAWGNPPVTPELLQAVARAGFNVVRIPVTWTLHMGAGPECWRRCSEQRRAPTS